MNIFEIFESWLCGLELWQDLTMFVFPIPGLEGPAAPAYPGTEDPETPGWRFGAWDDVMRSPHYIPIFAEFIHAVVPYAVCINSRISVSLLRLPWNLTCIKTCIIIQSFETWVVSATIRPCCAKPIISRKIAGVGLVPRKLLQFARELCDFYRSSSCLAS